MKTNIILNGDALTHLKKLPSESINCVMTSPPYWALRDYGSSVESIWDLEYLNEEERKIGKCFEGKEHEWIISNVSGDPRIKKRSESRAGWERPSRREYASRDVRNVCPICEKEFEGKPNQKFCSLECLNTLSNEERKSTRQVSNFCSRCGAWKGQLGLEPTFDLYIKHLCDVFDEVKRVLRKDGTCWINLGDTYSGSSNGKGDTKTTNRNKPESYKEIYKGQHSGKTNLPDKALCLIPFRFAIEMQNRGWILRNTIIWHKPNVMPSSVKDRFTVDFEYIFFFVKNKKYYFETQYDEIAESSFNDNRKDRGLVPHKEGKSYDPQLVEKKESLFGKNAKLYSWQLGQPESKNLDPLSSYPQELHSQTSDLGLNSDSILIQDDEDQEVNKSFLKQDLVGNPTYTGFNKRWKENRYAIMGTSINSYGRNKRTVWKITTKPFKEAHFAVYPEELCMIPIKSGCPENGIVLDPFFGSGTTGLVALKQNRKFIGIELNPEYIKIAEVRLKPYLEQEKLI